MEFFTGILFALAFYVFGFSWELLIALGIVAMLIIISVTDISYYIIPASGNRMRNRLIRAKNYLTKKFTKK